MWHMLAVAGTLLSWHRGQNLKGLAGCSHGRQIVRAAWMSISLTAASNSASALRVARADAALSNCSVVVALSVGGAFDLGAIIGLSFSTALSTWTAAGTGGLATVLAVATSTCVVLGGIALPAVLALGPVAPALPVLVGAGGAGGGSCLRDPELALPSFSSCTRVLSASILFLALGGWNHNLSSHI